jgi:hypothetical protein
MLEFDALLDSQFFVVQVKALGKGDGPSRLKWNAHSLNEFSRWPLAGNAILDLQGNIQHALAPIIFFLKWKFVCSHDSPRQDLSFGFVIVCFRAVQVRGYIKLRIFSWRWRGIFDT